MLLIRALPASELPAAADLLARAMRDDPMHRAVFGPDAAHRVDRLRCLFAALLPVMGRLPLSAWDGDRLVGVLGHFAPGTCRLSVLQRLRIAWPLRTFGPAELWRLHRWLCASEAHDPVEPHWHLGPVAVAVDRQRQGVGGRLLRAFCADIDRRGEVAFLETDKLDNVRFYGRCGFQVARQGKVLGTPNWWLRRPARPGPVHQAEVRVAPFSSPVAKP